jgi:hypothetical protein
LALWGGGELLFRISLWLEGRPQPGFFSFGTPLFAWVLSFGALIAPVFSIVYSSGGWFWPAFPWVANLMQIISELMPVSLTLILFGSGFILLFLLFSVVGYWGRSWVAGFSVTAVLVFSMLAFQARWLLFASFLGVFAFLLCVSRLVSLEEDYIPLGLRRILAGGSLLVVVYFVFVPNLVYWVNSHSARDGMFSRGGMFDRPLDEARLTALFRKEHGSGDFVVLGISDVGTRAAYYGGGRTVGSVYWEAWRGLKDETAFWGAQTEEEALEVVHRYGVDFIVLRPDISPNFGGIIPGVPTMRDRVMEGDLPGWLKPLDWEARGSVELKAYRIVLQH